MVLSGFNFELFNKGGVFMKRQKSNLVEKKTKRKSQWDITVCFVLSGTLGKNNNHPVYGKDKLVSNHRDAFLNALADALVKIYEH